MLYLLVIIDNIYFLNSKKVNNHLCNFLIRNSIVEEFILVQMLEPSISTQ